MASQKFNIKANDGLSRYKFLGNPTNDQYEPKQYFIFNTFMLNELNLE